MYSVKNDAVCGPDAAKLLTDVERKLGPGLLFGDRYSESILAMNVHDVLTHAKGAAPKTHDAWVAALVSEYKANLGAFAATVEKGVGIQVIR